MFDSKVVRRRRAALAVFIGLSVVMLTAYFGESAGGVFHTLQRGAQEAFAPFETGTGRALKPFRDLFGWFGDTIDAKDENERLQGEVEAPAQAPGRGGHRHAGRQPAAGAGQARRPGRLSRRAPTRLRRA